MPPEDTQHAAPAKWPPAATERVHVLDVPALIIFALLFFTVALQFFTRYVLNDSLGWTEEIARYLLILLGFSGSIICVRNNSHIALEFFYRYISATSARWIVIFCRLTVAVFFLYCGYLAIELAQRTSSHMASVELPKAIIYYLVSAFCFITGIFGFSTVRHHNNITRPMSD